MSALDVQVGGDHYKKYKIQPMEYSMANGLDACQHTAIKYITRFRDKGGIADLEKAKHCIDLLIEFECKGQVETTDLNSTERTFETLVPVAPMAPAPSGTCYKVGCPNEAVKYGACGQHQQKEDEATHRDGGGSKFKQNEDGRWMQWALDSWFFHSDDPKAVPGGLKPLPPLGPAVPKFDIPEGLRPPVGRACYNPSCLMQAVEGSSFCEEHSRGHPYDRHD